MGCNSGKQNITAPLAPTAPIAAPPTLLMSHNTHNDIESKTNPVKEEENRCLDNPAEIAGAVVAVLGGAAAAGVIAAALLSDHPDISDEELLRLIFKGILEGFVESSVPDVTAFVKDSAKVAEHFKKAIFEFEKQTVESMMKGLIAVGEGLWALHNAWKEFGAAEGELKKLVITISKLTFPEQFFFQAGHELIVNGVDILQHVLGATLSFKMSNWENLGKHIGNIVGDLTFAKTTVDTHSVFSICSFPFQMCWYSTCHSVADNSETELVCDSSEHSHNAASVDEPPAESPHKTPLVSHPVNDVTDLKKALQEHEKFEGTAA